MIRLSVLIACMTVACMAATAVARAGIAGDVVRVDHKKQCLWLDWDNNTEKIACWTEKTKFSILETGKPAKAAELRKGSYVRMQGDDKGDTYWATEIVIWEAQSKPGLRQ